MDSFKLDLSFESLRKEYPIFHFHSFYSSLQANELIINYDFEIEGLERFQPTISIELPKEKWKDLPPSFLCLLVFQYGLAEMISYWKLTCSPLIMIHCGYLRKEQIAFWQKLFYKGLGEFRYINKIDSSLEDFVSFEAHEDEDILPLFEFTESDACLLPIGGGKDSIVSLDLIKKLDTTFFLLNPRPSCLEIARLSRGSQVIAKRVICPELIELNKQGYLNGHTPFSALLAFMTLLPANALGISNIVLSNESSANEGNVNYLDDEVNHQYSKSWEFENDFRDYVEEFICKTSNYFSILRPLKEVQISRYFSNLSLYRSVFRSCNEGQKKDIWCGECSKCLFVYSILAPYISQDKLIDIFGSNLFNKAHLKDTFLALLGQTEQKPFECVGEYQEMQYVIEEYLSMLKSKESGEFLIEEFKSLKLPGVSLDLQSYWNDDNNLKEPFKSLVYDSCRA